MPSAWNKLVKKVFDREKKKNPDFKLGDAMKLAAKERKKGGDDSAVAESPVAETPKEGETKPESPITEEKHESETPMVSGGKKSRKGRNKRAKKTSKRRVGK